MAHLVSDPASFHVQPKSLASAFLQDTVQGTKPRDDPSEKEAWNGALV